MPRAHFTHVETWVFDLDNTLYPPTVRLFDQIETRMTEWVMRIAGVDAAEATRLRQHYWQTHGTTLAGLMLEHKVDPDPYLAHVHDIDLSAVPPHPALRAAIGRLPGRKVVFTNGSREHARRVTAALGLHDAFDALYGFEDAGYVPKPRPDAFAAIIARDGLLAGRAAMFEDDHRNLRVPHALGMRTVLVGAELAKAEVAAHHDPATSEALPGAAAPRVEHPHVHHRTEDLAGFLERLA